MTISSFAAANLAAIDIYADERDRLLPELKYALGQVVSSAVGPEKSAYLVEIVYANSAEFSEKSRKAVADVADFVTMMNFYGFGNDERGMKIASILRGGDRDNDSPAPLARFAANTITIESK